MMFTYYLRKALRDKGFIFWSLAFPLILMLCFTTTFKSASQGEIDFQPVNTALIIKSEGVYAEEFETLINNLADPEYVKESALGYNHEIMTLIPVDSVEDGEQKILDNKIEILFIVDGENEKIDVKVDDDPAMTTLMVARSVVESYRKNYALVKDAAMTAPDKLPQVMETMTESVSFMKAKTALLDKDGASANVYNWYFFSTIVMGMFFNATSGVNTVFDIQGNLSGYAMRTSVSPKKKWKILLSAFMARYSVACAITYFHLFALNKIFGIALNGRVFELIIFVLLGNLFSMSLGSIIGLFTKGEQNQREGKATGVIMLSVFFSGEMIMVIPGLFEKYCPILNRINPATIMNFAFYRLVHYPTLTGFWMNMIKIAVATVVFLTIAILKLRREKYAAI
ncbi:MAG: ABC transporter permease [Clostridiales bacterium]|nr:ABC transporter permease [Clostridiales bacterium]